MGVVAENVILYICDGIIGFVPVSAGFLSRLVCVMLSVLAIESKVEGQ